MQILSNMVDLISRVLKRIVELRRGLFFKEKFHRGWTFHVVLEHSLLLNSVYFSCPAVLLDESFSG